MIVPTINDVYYFSNEIKASHIRHDFKRDFDYLIRQNLLGAALYIWYINLEANLRVSKPITTCL